MPSPACWNLSARHPHRRLADCPACLAQLEEAVALYRGDFLSGFSLRDSPSFEEWVLVEREHLRRLDLEALNRLVACRAERGELELALGYAWRQVEMDPLWEHAQRQLIELLARSGRRDAALAQYQVCQRILITELGIPPEAETTVLYERIHDQKTPLAPATSRKHNLPVALTPFIGREVELDALNAGLDDPVCRMLTVSGPGGSGKTRLALEAAWRQVERFQDGAWLVELAALITPQTVPPSIAEALGFPLQKQPEPILQLKDYLRAKNLLLFLDSFERLLEGAGMLVELLEAAPGVKILVTSRQRLNLHGEQHFPLGGLDCPPPVAGLQDALGCGAVQLFVSTGRRARPGFELSAANLQHVRRICELVSCMPLGLLLAAAWLGAFSTAEIAAEIEGGLDFLSAGGEDLPARQRSLRATFDYSWNLLGEAERGALGRLSVFRGGFSRRAAEQVAGASARDLRLLVERSLIERSPSGRYHMHDLLRQYAGQKLVENPLADREAHERHTAYYLGMLPDWCAGLKSARQGDVLAQMDIESNNLGAAWVWAADNQALYLLVKGMEGLGLFASLRARYPEGQLACQHALDKLSTISEQPEVMRLSLQAIGWNAHFLHLTGKHAEATRLVAQGMAVLDGPGLQGVDTRAERAFLLLELGSALLPTDRPGARRYYQESLALYEALNNPWQQARALAGLGMVAHHSTTFEKAVLFYQRSLVLYEGLCDPNATAGVLIELGHNSLRQGLLEQGEAYIRRGCEYYERTGDRASLANSLFHLPRLYFWRGDFSRGLSVIDEIRPILVELGWIERYVFNVVGKVFYLAIAGDYEAARQQGQQGLAVAREEKFQRFEALAYFGLGIAELRVGEIQQAGEYLQRSIDFYRAIEQTDELGWALAALAYAELGLRRSTEFLSHLCEALQLGIKVHALFTLMLALPAAALYLVQRSQASQGQAAREDLVRAVELYALSRRYPTAANSPWFEDTAGKPIAAAAASLPPDVVEAAQARGREQDIFAVAQNLLDEFCQGA